MPVASRRPRVKAIAASIADCSSSGSYHVANRYSSPALQRLRATALINMSPASCARTSSTNASKSRRNSG